MISLSRSGGANPASRKRNRGYLWLFAAASVLGVALTQNAYQSSQTGSTATAKNVTQAVASSVIGNGQQYRTGYQTMLMNGLAPSQVTWDATAVTGLFHPRDGAVGQARPPLNSLTSTAIAVNRNWVYRANLQPNLSGLSAATYAVTIVGLKLAVCQWINKELEIATTETATPPASGLTAAAWNASASAIDITTVAAISGHKAGCLGTSDSEYAFYATLTEQ